MEPMYRADPFARPTWSWTKAGAPVTGAPVSGYDDALVIEAFARLKTRSAVTDGSPRSEIGERMPTAVGFGRPAVAPDRDRSEHRPAPGLHGRPRPAGRRDRRLPRATGSGWTWARWTGPHDAQRPYAVVPAAGVPGIAAGDRGSGPLRR